MEQAATTQHKHPYSKDTDILLPRMRRIEGQARGITKMIEEDRYCPDIIQQLIALTSAAREVSLLLLEDHVQGCVAEAIKSGDGDEVVQELIAVVRRAART